MHEMFHALGRFHEQSRPDRDQFVRINLQNIQSGKSEHVHACIALIILQNHALLNAYLRYLL